LKLQPNFTRDIGFVIDVFIKSNILPDRERELDAIQYVIDQINYKSSASPEEVHIEGGDVMLWNDYILLELIKEVITKTILQQEQIRREFNKDLFPNKIVKEFDLVKSKIEARQCTAFRLLFSAKEG
jgi:arginine deiminase